jgi:hypothetical protein
MRHKRRLTAVLLSALLVAAVLLASTSAADRLFSAQRIDVGIDKPAVQVGAAIGNTRAWAGFVQERAGKQRLYVRYARNGRFRRFPKLADRGNEVTGAGLVGDTKGRALVVWGEQVGGKGVVFSRRLRRNVLGPVVRVTAEGSDVDFANLDMNPFYDRSRNLAMNRNGGAAFCYTDANNKHFIAIRAPGAVAWVLHEIQDSCGDLGIDDRGNAVAIGNANKDLFANKVIAGQVVRELVTDDLMDEVSIAVGPGGTALIMYRPDTDSIFVRRKRDIAQGGAWEKIGGNAVLGIMIDDGRSPEDPYAALDARGNGIFSFRDNVNDIDKKPSIYYRLVTGGNLGGGGTIAQRGANRARVAVNRLGRPVITYTNAAPGTDNDPVPKAYVRVFRRGLPLPARLLVNGRGHYVGPNILGLAVDGPGNVLALTNEIDPSNFNGVALFGTFGDFSKPKLRPRAAGVGRLKVRINSRATDSFATIRSRDVRWRVPRGVRIVKAFRKRGRNARGKKITIRVRRFGRYRIRIRVRDRGGNVTRRVFRLRVRRGR